jgi:hypothetical protein
VDKILFRSQNVSPGFSSTSTVDFDCSQSLLHQTITTMQLFLLLLNFFFLATLAAQRGLSSSFTGGEARQNERQLPPSSQMGKGMGSSPSMMAPSPSSSKGMGGMSMSSKGSKKGMMMMMMGMMGMMMQSCFPEGAMVEVYDEASGVFADANIEDLKVR